MGRSLDEVKRDLRQRYFGKFGIHGIGLRQSEKAVCLYVGRIDEFRSAGVLEEIERKAAPYSVRVIEEEPPRAL